MTKKDYITITKLVSGSLILRFEDVTAYGRTADISFEVSEEQKRIPTSLAASVFSNPIAASAYKKGLFKFGTDEDHKAAYALAVELGLVYEEPKYEGTSYTASEMKYFLVNARKKELADIIANGGDAQQRLLYETAVSVADKLTVSLIDYLEGELKLSILTEGE